MIPLLIKERTHVDEVTTLIVVYTLCLQIKNSMKKESKHTFIKFDIFTSFGILDDLT